MKRIIIAMLISLVGAGAWADEFRIFTDIEGRAIEGRIASFSLKRGEVEIERRDGKRVWVRPTIFSAEDQEYIKEWAKAFRVLDDSSLRIAFKKLRLDKYGSKKDLKEGDNVCFEVTFENRADSPIEGMRIEYRYFIKVVGSGKTEDSMRHVDGSARVKRIEGRKSQKITTRRVGIEETYVKKKEFGYSNGSWGTPVYETVLKKVSEDQLEGIWIRIYGPSVAGTPTYRDVSFPKELKDKQRWE